MSMHHLNTKSKAFWGVVWVCFFFFFIWVGFCGGVWLSWGLIFTCFGEDKEEICEHILTGFACG